MGKASRFGLNYCFFVAVLMNEDGPVSCKKNKQTKKKTASFGLGESSWKFLLKEKTPGFDATKTVGNVPGPTRICCLAALLACNNAAAFLSASCCKPDMSRLVHA